METEALLLDEDLTVRAGIGVVPRPRAGQALVAVRWAGVCGSDLRMMRTGDRVTYWPAIIGRELAGVVSSCPGGELLPGTAVVVDSRVPCRACAGCQCAANLCERLAWVGEAHPGGYSAYCTLDVRNLVPCPDTLEPTVAVLAEPLAVAMHGLGKVAGEPERILLIGHGPLGALFQLEARRRWPQAAIEVVEPIPARRDLARALGAQALFPADGRRCRDLVIDASGYDGSLADAVEQCANGGTVLLAALGSGNAEVSPAQLAERSLTVAGVKAFDGELPLAVARLADDPDRYRPIITEALLLDEAAERLPRLAESPSAGKVVISPCRS
ncbi:zinc-dependent alcohol dehydrogenase [Streptomyces canus]|uniref:zinc-dependent alcohol dehydrogenase n=1 Tax=Streptomyces canus TaxID=58343 RepID=UPI0033A6D8C3